MLWLRRDLAVRHPYALDRMLVSTGLAGSLTEARQLIGQGAVCVNNEKMIPPEGGFLPVPVVTEMNIDEYIALGMINEVQ